MKNHNITSSLALASLTALGVTQSSAQLGDSDLLNTDFKGSLLYYQEADRVTAIEAIVDANYQIDAANSIQMKLTVDSLTGASASGAVATDRDQTFTTPSGNSNYTTKANETPLDPTFLDTRYALSANWTRRWNLNWKSELGGNFSNEYDYMSFSGRALIHYNTDDSNRIYSAGITYAHDTIDPVGGVPQAFGLMTNPGEVLPRIGIDDTKTTFDFLVGVTQVIDKRSLMQFNYSLSSSSGYHTDPYKFISVIGPDGRPAIADLATGLSSVVFENRPDSRTKHSFYFQYKRDLLKDHVFDASYRYMMDDWGVNSHTLDFRYKYRLSETSYLQPHLRVYQQSAADFYTPFFVSGSEPSAGDDAVHASADYRLGEMTAFTIGLEYGRDNVDRPWSIALEYYLQSLGTIDNQFGELLNQDLNEDVSAVMVRFNIDF